MYGNSLPQTQGLSQRKSKKNKNEPRKRNLKISKLTLVKPLSFQNRILIVATDGIDQFIYTGSRLGPKITSFLTR